MARVLGGRGLLLKVMVFVHLPWLRAGISAKPLMSVSTVMSLIWGYQRLAILSVHLVVKERDREVLTGRQDPSSSRLAIRSLSCGPTPDSLDPRGPHT